MDESAQPTQFMTGFVLGLCAGAFGYYLFGTKEGSKTRKLLLEEWHTIRDELVEKGQAEAGVGLREFFSNVLSQVSGTEIDLSDGKKSAKKKTAQSDKSPDDLKFSGT